MRDDTPLVVWTGFLTLSTMLRVLPRSLSRSSSFPFISPVSHLVWVMTSSICSSPTTSSALTKMRVFSPSSFSPSSRPSLCSLSHGPLPLSRAGGEHGTENVYEIVQTPQVAILVVALHPGGPVVQGEEGRQGHRLPKVYHPHTGLPRRIMHKQQGAAHHLGKNRTVEFSASVLKMHYAEIAPPFPGC